MQVPLLDFRFFIDEYHKKTDHRFMENPLFQPITLEKLLEGRNFIVYKEQLIFYHQELKQYVITTISPQKKYTATDYISLPENAPYQLIEGELIFMASPFTNHQKISGKLYRILSNYIYDNQLGDIYFAPLDVHLDKENVYQPDILFISIKRSSIIQKFIFGAPDFVVEILSKSTEEIDRTKKMTNYGKFGVDEYWMVDLNNESIEVYHNTLSVLIHKQTAKKGDKIVSKAIEGFELEVAEVF